MNLYIIHCGFYDDQISSGVYEFHINIPVVEKSLDAAKNKVRLNESFKNKKMHIDGIQEINIVDGFALNLAPVAIDLENPIQIKNHLYRR